MHDIKRLVFLGAPGAGKGTYAVSLSQMWNIPAICTGDILRSNVEQSTDLGRQAKEYMDCGVLVPDQLVNQMVADRLEEADTGQGFILDGYPRTTKQAEALNEVLLRTDRNLSAVINIEVPREIIIQRLTGRRVCPKCKANFNVNTNLLPKQSGICDNCGAELIRRSDDQEETIVRRLQIYEEQTAPVIEFYRRAGLLRTISAVGEINEIVGMIRSAAEWNQ